MEQLNNGMLGVKRKLDIFGVLTLSFVASSAGGIMRDVLIGAVPPAAVSDWRYVAVATAAGLTIFFGYSPVSRLHKAISVFDAMGLALFAVAGTEKALAFGLNPVMAALLGMVTGVGGGAPETSWSPEHLPFSRATSKRSQRWRAQGWLLSVICSPGRWFRPRLVRRCYASLSGSWRCADAGNCPLHNCLTVMQRSKEGIEGASAFGEGCAEPSRSSSPGVPAKCNRLAKIGDP